MKLNGNSRLKGVLAYDELKILGAGKFGTCYEIKKNEETRVIKIFNPRDVKRRKVKLSLEWKILNALNHPQIPKFYEKLDKDGLYGFTMEKKEGISLDHLIELWEYDFTQAEVFKILNELIAIISVLHPLGITHDDIKTSNILYDFKGTKNLALVDFGSAKRVEKVWNNRDFWGIGDVFLNLAYASKELAFNPDRLFIEDLALTLSEKKIIKSLLAIEKPYRDVAQLLKESQGCFKKQGEK